MIEPAFIRNFCIIAHIDHGKSTLCDRLLELTGQIKAGQTVERVLDTNPISRERGITIKLAPVTMFYTYQGKKYQLNMIDTPGHVDFNYEVSRSLAAADGAILLVDASQGIQAQTLSYWQKATKLGLPLIGVINKIDLPTAQVETVTKDMVEHFGFKASDIVLLSAKTGQGVSTLLDKIIQFIPSPPPSHNRLQALIFDSFYHPYKGVIVYLRVVSGEINAGNLNFLYLVGSHSPVKGVEIGVFQPVLTRVDRLGSGQVGYLATGLKDISRAQVGDTITEASNPALPLTGYQPPRPVVFLNYFPSDPDDFEVLKEGLNKLKLNDASFTHQTVYSEALGKGFRCGFLGLLHAEIVQERLENEHQVDLVATQPSVTYQIKKGEQWIFVNTPVDLPAGKSEVLEPIVLVTIFTPEKYIGNIIALCENKRGKQVDVAYFGLQVKITYELPLDEIMVDFFDKLKAASSGFASYDYQLIKYSPLSAVRLDILVHGRIISALSMVVPAAQAYLRAKEIVERFRSILPRQLFEYSIQAAIGSKVIAKAKISAFRKDVTAKLYGGDQTRKDKLLKKQVKGKKRLKKIGQVSIPQEAFLAVLKRD